MDTKRFAVTFAFMLALATGTLSTHAAGTNSKGFTAPKFDTHSAARDEDDDKNNNELSDKNQNPVTAQKMPIGFTQTGKASFYGGRWNGCKTANGEIYNQMTLTAAHKTLPFNCHVRVRNLLNNKEVIVRINNRGPYARGRIIDLSVGAANLLEMRKIGIVPVEICVVQ
jgi:rare lipoprotein A